MLVKLNVIATLILLLCTIPAPAASTSPLAIEGCQSRCGSFDISYPFGMGSPDCFYNKWFEILCHDERPHLHLNQDANETYEVLRIGYYGDDYHELEIRSNTSNMRVCKDTSKLLAPNLTATPFYYSRGDNKFMLVGSGTANFVGNSSSILENGGVEGGCTSVSSGRRSWSGINPCYGLDCCQDNSLSAHYFCQDNSLSGQDVYSLTEFRLNYSNSVAGNNSCAYAFLVKEDWYPQNTSLFLDPSADLDGISVPFSLRWNITKSMPGQGFQNNKYCHADSGDGWGCWCPCGFAGNPYIVNGCQERRTSYICLASNPAPANTTSPLAKEGCKSYCGSFNISYPFGMGSAECYYNKWFEILCLNDRPHLHLGRVLEVSGTGSLFQKIGDTYQTLEISSNTSYMRACEDTSKLLGLNLTGSPFYYSPYNKFMLVGSGTANLLGSNGVEGGCSSVTNERRSSSGIYRCHGVNCCEDNSLNDQYHGHYVTELSVNYSNSLAGNSGCASAFMVMAYWYPENISLFSADPSSTDLAGISVPFSLNWHIPKSMPGHGFRNNKYCDVDHGSWYCSCPCGFDGNPYIVDGCQDRTSSDCSIPYVKRNFKSLLVGGIFSLISVLTATIYLLYKAIRRRINRKLKERMFKRNGGPLLQKYLSSNQNIMEKVRLFTGKDMNKATDQFNDNRVLGRGGQGTVYKGMLADGKIVAIKKSKSLANANHVEEFINEIIILSQIDHRNVVKLFGCCLEMDVPLLVYEYIPNGTLYNLIHNDDTDFPLTWEVRLRISLELAEALTYLHTATSIPIYHRDIKSTNILLDEKYKAKMADFGTSRHIGVDQTHLTTLVKGTFGYLDPEYFQSSQFTDKSDVYSFGVVLVELLTGLKPICFSEEEQSHLNLATRFLLAVEENCVHIILDPQVIKTSTEEEREAIIRLSQRCLNMNGRNRPSMKEIAMELQSIKRSEIPPAVLENSYGNVCTSFHITTSSPDESPFSSSSF